MASIVARCPAASWHMLIATRWSPLVRNTDALASVIAAVNRSRLMVTWLRVNVPVHWTVKTVQSGRAHRGAR